MTSPIRLASRDTGPRGVDLLQRREHALCAQGQRAEDGQRRGNTPVLTTQAVCKCCDQHHAERLHRVARALRDEDVGALRPPQGLVGLTIGLAIHRLRAIQQHVAYATQTFLQCLHDLGVLVRDAVATQPASRDRRDRHSCPQSRSRRRYLRVNRERAPMIAMRSDPELTRVKGQEYAEHRAANLARDSGDHLAAAATDVNAVGLVERSPVHLPAEVGAGTEGESRACPGEAACGSLRR